VVGLKPAPCPRSKREPVGTVLAEASPSARWKPPPVRQCAWHLRQPHKQLKSEEHAFLTDLVTAAPYPIRAAELARNFVNKSVTAVLAPAIPGRRPRAIVNCGALWEGIQHGEAAVRAGLAELWSTSPVKGPVSRLKPLKRQRYGRAKYELLRSRVLAAA
jgi:transposase